MSDQFTDDEDVIDITDTPRGVIAKEGERAKAALKASRVDPMDPMELPPESPEYAEKDPEFDAYMRSDLARKNLNTLRDTFMPEMDDDEPVNLPPRLKADQEATEKKRTALGLPPAEAAQQTSTLGEKLSSPSAQEEPDHLATARTTAAAGKDAANKMWELEKSYNQTQQDLALSRSQLAKIDISAPGGRELYQSMAQRLDMYEARLGSKFQAESAALDSKLYPVSDPELRATFNSFLEDGLNGGDAHYYATRHNAILQGLSAAQASGADAAAIEQDLLKTALTKDEKGRYRVRTGMDVGFVLDKINGSIGKPGGASTGRSKEAPGTPAAAAKAAGAIASQIQKIDDALKIKGLDEGQKADLQARRAEIIGSSPPDAIAAAEIKKFASGGSLKDFNQTKAKDYVWQLSDDGLNPPKVGEPSNAIAIKQGKDVKILEIDPGQFSPIYKTKDGKLTKSKSEAEGIFKGTPVEPIPFMQAMAEIAKMPGGGVSEKGGHGVTEQVWETTKDVGDVFRGLGNLLTPGRPFGGGRSEDRVDERFIRANKDRVDPGIWDDLMQFNTQIRNGLRRKEVEAETEDEDDAFLR